MKPSAEKFKAHTQAHFLKKQVQAWEQRQSPSQETSTFSDCLMILMAAAEKFSKDDCSLTRNNQSFCSFTAALLP